MAVSGQGEFSDRLKVLVKEYRTLCLWFIREDFFSRTSQDALRVLKYIERRGDRKGFVEARELRIWLLHHFNVRFAD